jgi:drug/metabolite transporter (DMT)-like permease
MLGLIIVMYSFFAVMDHNPTFLAFIVIFINVGIIFGAFGYDERAHFDKYAAILPIGRKCVVAARYLETFLMTTILTVIMLPLCNFVSEDPEYPVIQILMTASSAAILISAILFPIIYKIGIEKARIAIFAICFIPSGVVIALNKFGIGQHLLDNISADTIQMLIENLQYIAPVIAIACLCISFFIAYAIVAKKEY